MEHLGRVIFLLKEIIIIKSRLSKVGEYLVLSKNRLLIVHDSRLKVCYLNGTSHLNNKLLVHYLDCDLNSEEFNYLTGWNHLNTELVCYSDPHCGSPFLRPFGS